MALEIPAGLALSVAVSSNRTASKLSSASATTLDPARATALSEGFVAGRYVTRSVTLDTAAASSALRQSVYAGTSIRDALKELSNLAELAAQGGLVSSSTALLSSDGTRVSRGNIQTQIDRAVGLINALVKASANGSANFIDANGPIIRVQTTKYGGTVSITPQGLDSNALGISNLDVSTTADALLSQQRLLNAASLAGSRLDRLTQLQSALGQTSGFDQSLIFASSSTSGTLPVGAFVNLSA